VSSKNCKIKQSDTIANFNGKKALKKAHKRAAVCAFYFSFFEMVEICSFVDGG